MCELLDPKKDIDGITLASLASVFTDGHAGYPPATAAACIQLLDHYQVPLQGKHVVVVGRSLVVGKPVSMMLLRRNASVTICHSKTENLADIMRSADVVICATGRARTFGAQFFGPGQTVLDVGINFDTQGNLCGDVDFAEVEPVVAAITPVPGGIGTVTTSVTMAHTVAAAEAALAARTGEALDGAPSPMGRKFVIADPATCIGCKTCMAACFSSRCAERRGRSASHAGHHAPSRRLWAATIAPRRRAWTRAPPDVSSPTTSTWAYMQTSASAVATACWPARTAPWKSLPSCRPNRARVRRRGCGRFRPGRQGRPCPSAREEAQAHEIDR